MTLKKFVMAKNEPDWFVQKRQASFDLISQLPMPPIQRFDYHNWQLTPPTTDIIKTKVSSTDDYVLMDIFDSLEAYPEII